MVKVYVGQERQLFTVHKELLVTESSYFEAALKKEWHEGQTREVELTNEKAYAFNLFAEWLYFGKIDCNQLTSKRGQQLIGVRNVSTPVNSILVTGS